MASSWPTTFPIGQTTTMLLGAARYLAETRNFEGTVRFIFQPRKASEVRRPCSKMDCSSA
jgi:hypothetical protein